MISGDMPKNLRQLFSGLQWRLLLLGLLAGAPLVGLMLHAASEDRRRLVADWNQRTQDLMQLASQEEAQLLGQTRQLLLALAESTQVRSGKRDICEKLLNELFSSYPRYARLGVVGTNGAVLASTPSMKQASNESGRAYLSRVLATRVFAVGNFPDGQRAGKPLITFGQPVLNAAGQVQAVVFAALDLDWVSRFESALPARLPTGVTWSQIDRTGKILVRYPSPEKWIGQPLPEQTLLNEVFTRERGVVEAVSAEGIPGYHAFAARPSQLVPGEAVTILGSISKQALFAEVDDRLTANLTALGVAGCLAFVLGWIGSSLLVLRPVRTLVASSARLATGDLSVRTGLTHRGDELGQLTRTFDQMAQELERREAERQAGDAALKASEVRYRRLFESAQDGILILNADTGQIDDVNPFLTDLLGYEREQLLGNKLWEIGPFKDTAASKASFRELQRKAYVRYEDLPLETSAGKAISVEFVSNVYPVNGHKVIQCNIRDITQRKQADASRRAYDRRLAQLSRRLVAAQETERRNIARELHDELGQTLTVAQLNLQALLQTPGNAGEAHARASVAAVDQLLEQVRDISLNLRPTMLDDLGLQPALEWLTRRQSELAGLTGEVQAGALAQRLDPLLETECFRIAQEALTNVVRHAQANFVTVKLQEADGQLHLRIRDDGVGFDVATTRDKAIRGSSLGLLSMEERAARAGGQLEFISAPGRGSEVHAWFPLKWLSPAPATPVS